MSKPDLLFMVSLIIFLFGVLFLFIKGKNIYLNIYKDAKLSTRLRRLIPLLTSLTLFIGLVSISISYKLERQAQEIQYQKILLELKKADSVRYNEQKKRGLDSLNFYRNELISLLQKIKKQHFLDGSNVKEIEKVQALLSLTEEEIERLKGYNEIIDAKKIFKKQKGFSASSVDPVFDIPCPTIDKEEVALLFFIADKKQVDSIACISVEVLDKLTGNSYDYVYSQTYKPQRGLNVIKIKNDRSKNNIELRVGYFLKRDYDKEYPTFIGKICSYGKHMVYLGNKRPYEQ
jgi:hypothetical protein